MRKTYPKLILVLVLTSMFWNCNVEKELTESEFEKAVFYDVFPSILDSIYFDKRLVPPPPPSPEFFDKYENIDDAIKDYKKSKEFKQGIKKWQRKKDSLKQDKTSIYIVISDSILSIEKENIYKLIKHYKNQNLVSDSKNIESIQNFKIDIDKLKSNNDNFKFKYQSEFPKGREFWRTEYEFYIGGKIEFSHIIFDETKTHGILNAGFGTGILNGNGYKVYIRKSDNGKWLIDKVIQFSIS